MLFDTGAQNIMPSIDNIKTGTIAKIDPQLQAGYIVPDGDGVPVYFTFENVEKAVGIGVAMENHRVQFVQGLDQNSNKLIATQVIVLPATES
jgi:hypothetical protein